MADVEAMFHQVQVTRRDQDMLRFLWWPRGRLEESPAEYRMTVHLFVGTWSPSCCTYALHRTAEDHAREHSDAARETVLCNFYVDDCLKSVATEEEAIVLTKQLKELVARGGFNLTKWTSHSQAVLREIPVEDQSKKVKERPLDAPLEDRALVVDWSMEGDEFGFKSQQMAKPLTKRGILSMLSSVYGPLGIAGPFILGARRIMQELYGRRSDGTTGCPSSISSSGRGGRKAWKRCQSYEYPENMVYCLSKCMLYAGTE